MKETKSPVFIRTERLSVPGGGNAVQGVPSLACDANGMLAERDGGHSRSAQSDALSLLGNHTVFIV